jgi:hypothetical protein
VVQCEKCNRIFKYQRDLTRHRKRKTPCKPIAGDPTKVTGDNKCHFCYRQMANKKSLKNHFRTCKIKNGGMELLFHELAKLKSKEEQMLKKIELLERKDGIVQHPVVNNYNTINNVMNHHNTTLNINLMNFDSPDHVDRLKLLLKDTVPAILGAPVQVNVEHMVQVKDRIQQLVVSCLRNPDYSDMQNVYVADQNIDKKTEHVNAFVYDNDKWQIRDWHLLRQDILSKIYMHVDANKHVREKSDVLDVMKHVFILAGLGESNVEKMTDAEVSELYFDMGKKLEFATILKL